ncbi:MAG: hypothetical protein A3H96_05715 [Acidobacteria bacterium RIFCSPLOWO2_02_FULL_67_36]|nr:MAG: hypothetical protein A3H96_05715 [Acidobacteria bacterium RIFCSPLOWO2_02_FULL_67_36]OFW19752.1 MAG: hypothetical protein A3G21_13295 [Acidobacteria bacterium RIFCSPLOWO2_12_FULL_66_21]
MLAAVALGIAMPIAAQDPPQERVSVSAGGGIADPWHGDLQFQAAAWTAGVRMATSDHVRVEVFAGEWRHSSGEVRTNVTFQGPNGPEGTVDRLTQRTQWVTSAYGFNVLASGSSGGVTLSAGGGPGFMQLHRAFTQTLEGCHGAVSCTSYTNRFSNGALSVQAVVTLDLAIASRVGAFGQYQIVIPTRDVGSGHGAFLGGVRIRLM